MSRSVSHLVFCLIMPAPRFCTPVTIGIAFARAIYLDSRYSNLQIWTIYFLRNEDLMTHHQPTTDGPKPAVKSVAVNYINYDFNPHLISISFLSLSALSRPSSTVGDTRGTRPVCAVPWPWVWFYSQFPTWAVSSRQHELSSWAP